MKNYFVHPLPVLPSPRKKNTLKTPFKGPVPRVLVIIMPDSGHNMGQDLDYIQLSCFFIASLSKASIASFTKNYNCNFSIFCSSAFSSIKPLQNRFQIYMMNICFDILTKTRSINVQRLLHHVSECKGVTRGDSPACVNVWIKQTSMQCGSDVGQTTERCTYHLSC